MEIAPQIFTAKVMHKRLSPKVNAFTYRIYYLALPLPVAPLPAIVQGVPVNDLGYRDGRSPELWAKEILSQHNMADTISQIMLITMPRVLGYVFNPVSFYLCFDDQMRLRAVINEVHNTFGEQHSYLCLHADRRPIEAEDWLEAEKVFHVSPFLERNGHYRFRFQVQPSTLGIWIDYYDQQQNRQLLTALTGRLSPLSRRSLARAFWAHPLVTGRAIGLIHWQALKLAIKGIRYIPKPRAREDNVTISANLTKM